VELGALAVPGGSIKYQPRAIPAPSMRQHARCGLITLLTANFIARPTLPSRCRWTTAQGEIIHATDCRSDPGR
jgi:hypothetical protein